MAGAKYTVQSEIRVYDDNSGDYVSVGMDADALGLVELHQIDNGKQVARITTEPAQMRLLALAIIKYVDELPKED